MRNDEVINAFHVFVPIMSFLPSGVGKIAAQTLAHLELMGDNDDGDGCLLSRHLYSLHFLPSVLASCQMHHVNVITRPGPWYRNQLLQMLHREIAISKATRWGVRGRNHQTT